MNVIKKIPRLLHVAIIFGLATQLMSCTDNDGGPNVHPNGIKILNVEKQKITPSRYTFGTNPEVAANSLELVQGDDDVIYIGLIASDTIYISLGDDFNIDGKTIVVRGAGFDAFVGRNFTVTPANDAYVLTGSVTNAAKETRTLTIRVEETQMGAGNSSYIVQGDMVFLEGTLGTLTYNQIIDINQKYPAVETIVLTSISGSVNDDVNVETGRLIRKAGYGTHLLADSEVNSGGVDLFCSGKKRTREKGSKIGVHSWCCYEGKTADQLPENSPGHNSQLAYFREMLGKTDGPLFYFFTLRSSPFSGIHIMTEEEIDQYKLITE